MKRSSFPALLLLLSSAALVVGDTVTLKDGTVLEGTILKENETSYSMSVQVTAGIKDERLILKSKVQSVVRSGPDDIAFEEIENLFPAPDRLTADQYKERIGRGQAFLNVHAKSKHAEKVQEMMAKLEEERKLAAGGALKLDGNWISASERAANAYEIDAKIEIGEMAEDLQAGRFHLALRHFEKIEEDFSASEKYPEARDLALDALSQYKPIVANDYARVDARLKKRDDEMQRLPLSDRRKEEATIAARDARYKQRIEAERKARTKWLTLDPLHKEPLRQVLSNIEAALRKLEQPPPEDAKFAGPLYRQAWAAALAGNFDEGKQLVSDLKSLKVPERYLLPLEERLEPAEDADARKPAEVATAKPEEPEVEEKPKEKRKPKGTQARTPVTDDSGGSASGAEEEKRFPIQIVLVIVLAVVIVGALLAAFAGKKKAK